MSPYRASTRSGSATSNVTLRSRKNEPSSSKSLVMPEPVVPGVKMIEMCAQTGNVAWGIYQMASKVSQDELQQMVGFFTQIDKGSFKKMVRPGDTVLCQASFGEEGYFRNHMLTASGRIRHSVWFSVIAADWPRLKHQLQERLVRDAGEAALDVIPFSFPTVWRRPNEPKRRGIHCGREA